jgi:hypothetical protein
LADPDKVEPIVAEPPVAEPPSCCAFTLKTIEHDAMNKTKIKQADINIFFVFSFHIQNQKQKTVPLKLLKIRYL